jgi:outer membrane protein
VGVVLVELLFINSYLVIFLFYFWDLWYNEVQMREKMKSRILISALAVFALFAIPVMAAEKTDKIENCADITDVPQVKLTLPQVIDLGLCRSSTTKQAYESLMQAKYSKYQGYANYLPSASASAGKSWPENGGSRTTAGLSASWLIFDFGKRESDIGALISNFNSAGFEYDLSVQTLIYDLINSYYSLLMARADEDTTKNSLDIAQKSFDMAAKKYKLGVVAKADKLKAETQLASAKVNMQKATGARYIAEAKLLNQLSFPQGQHSGLDDNVLTPDLEVRDISELMETAKSLRPDLKSSKESLDAADYKLYSSYLRNLPSISASAGTDYNLDNDTSSSSVSLRVSMPIFAGFANFNSVRAAHSQKAQAEMRYSSKESAVEQDVWNSYQNYKTAVEVMKSSETLQKSAKESERVVSGMYNVGKATMLDWLTAQSDLASANKQAVEAKYDLLIKKYALALAIGELGNE